MEGAPPSLRKWHNAQSMKNKNSTKLRNRDIKISGWTFHVLGRRSSKKHCSHLRFSPCRAKRAEKSKTCTWRQKWPENDLLRHSHLECNLLPEPSKTKKSNLLPEPQNPPQLDSCRFREEANGFELQKSKKTIFSLNLATWRFREEVAFHVGIPQHFRHPGTHARAIYKLTGRPTTEAGAFRHPPRPEPRSV